MINVNLTNNTGRRSIIVDENETLRNTLEQNDVDYSVAMVMLDGTKVQTGELDKTFAELGITEKCYLSAVVKVDLAATVKVAGPVVMVESAYSMDELDKVKTYRPKALSLFEGEGRDKTEVFRVGTTEGKGSVTACGVSFGATSPTSGKAIVTLDIPQNVEAADVKTWVAKKIGTSILSLKKVEQGLDGTIAEIDAEQADIESCITMM